MDLLSRIKRPPVARVVALARRRLSVTLGGAVSVFAGCAGEPHDPQVDMIKMRAAMTKQLNGIYKSSGLPFIPYHFSKNLDLMFTFSLTYPLPVPLPLPCIPALGLPVSYKMTLVFR